MSRGSGTRPRRSSTGGAVRFWKLQIDRQTYERSGKAISNFRQTLPAADSDLAPQATKDPYLLDFLGSCGDLRERQVEQALIDHVERFLLELGQGFAFVGRQLRLSIAREDFFLDLLFFHHKLNRFVVIELKAVRFEPGFVGQLGTYMAAIDDQIKSAHHEPTIGLLLCKTKNALLAEYAVRSHTGPMGWRSGRMPCTPASRSSWPRNCRAWRNLRQNCRSGRSRSSSGESLVLTGTALGATVPV
jgi:predicted nuclease of restriction endonuclease-like (RecB) superfamily